MESDQMPCPRCLGRGNVTVGFGWSANIIPCTLCNGTGKISSKEFQLCPTCKGKIPFSERRIYNKEVCLTCKGDNAVKIS